MLNKHQFLIEYKYFRFSILALNTIPPVVSDFRATRDIFMMVTLLR